jgi:hypothetical protein
MKTKNIIRFAVYLLFIAAIISAIAINGCGSKDHRAGK